MRSGQGGQETKLIDMKLHRFEIENHRILDFQRTDKRFKMKKQNLILAVQEAERNSRILQLFFKRYSEHVGEDMIRNEFIEKNRVKEISFSDFRFISFKGRGNVATTYVCSSPRFARNNYMFVMKLFNESHDQENRLKWIKRDGVTVDLPYHPNIATIFHLVDSERITVQNLPSPPPGLSKSIYMIDSKGVSFLSPMVLMKHYECDLVRYIKKRIEIHFPFRDIEVCRILGGILRGCNHLQENRIVHRDLKLNNVLVDSVLGEVGICDFGCCLDLRQSERDNDDIFRVKIEADYEESAKEEFMFDVCDHPDPYLLIGGWKAHLPPEILKIYKSKKKSNGTVYDYSKSDLFACGMIGYELLSIFDCEFEHRVYTGPFGDLLEKKERVLRFSQRSDEHYIPLRNCHPLLSDLISSLLRVDPKDRIGYCDAVSRIEDVERMLTFDVSSSDDEGSSDSYSSSSHGEVEEECTVEAPPLIPVSFDQLSEIEQVIIPMEEEEKDSVGNGFFEHFSAISSYICKKSGTNSFRLLFFVVIFEIFCLLLFFLKLYYIPNQQPHDNTFNLRKLGTYHEFYVPFFERGVEKFDLGDLPESKNLFEIASVQFDIVGKNEIYPFRYHDCQYNNDKARMEYWLARINQIMGNYSVSADHLSRFNQLICEGGGDRQDEWGFLNAHGQMLESYQELDLGNWDVAERKARTSYTFLSLLITRTHPLYSHIMGSCLSMLGSTYRMTKKLKKALDNLKQSLSHFVRYGDVYRVAQVHNNIANVYFDLKKYRKALDSYQESIWVNEKHFPGSKNLAEVYFNYAVVSCWSGMYQQSMDYFEKAEKTWGGRLDSHPLHRALFLKERGILKARMKCNSEAFLDLLISMEIFVERFPDHPEKVLLQEALEDFFRNEKDVRNVINNEMLQYMMQRSSSLTQFAKLSPEVAFMDRKIGEVGEGDYLAQNVGSSVYA